MATFRGFDGTVMYYEEEGAGSPVVLLHGLSVNTEQNWMSPGIWSQLVKAGHRVVGFDARGHGRSGKPHDPSAYQHDAMVKDVAACFDRLGLAEADLAGYSMGASTALQFAATDDRVRRLVLGGIGGDPKKWGAADDRRVAMREQWLAALEAEDPDALEDPAARTARRVFEARGNDLHAISALLRADRRHLSPDMASAAVECPTLVVCGDRDASPTALAAALSKGQALVIEGDHESAVRNPELARAIVRFFAD